MNITNIFITGFITAVISVVSSPSFAEEYFCISNNGKPKHCNAGDIILVKPTMVPRVCDFSMQILRMPKGEKSAEYVCRYTGTILGVKELKSRQQIPNQAKNMRPPSKKRKNNNNNNMFNSMPFFK